MVVESGSSCQLLMRLVAILQSMNVPDGNDDEQLADGEVMQYMYKDEVNYTIIVLPIKINEINNLVPLSLSPIPTSTEDARRDVHSNLSVMVCYFTPYPYPSRYRPRFSDCVFFPQDDLYDSNLSLTGSVTPPRITPPPTPVNRFLTSVNNMRRNQINVQIPRYILRGLGRDSYHVFEVKVMYHFPTHPSCDCMHCYIVC